MIFPNEGARQGQCVVRKQARLSGVKTRDADPACSGQRTVSKMLDNACVPIMSRSHQHPVRHLPAIILNRVPRERGHPTIRFLHDQIRRRKVPIAALTAGKDVLVEKPFAVTLEDCQAMAACAQTIGRTLMVGHILRFDPRYTVLREEVSSGRLGKIVSMSAKRGRMRGGFQMYERTHPALCNCVHDIDIMLSLERSPVIRVRGFERRIHSTRNPDWVTGILEFASGAIGEVHTNWLLPDAAGIGLDDALQITAEHGSASLTMQPAGVSIWSEKGYTAPDAGYETRMYGAAHGALLNELL